MGRRKNRKVERRRQQVAGVFGDAGQARARRGGITYEPLLLPDAEDDYGFLSAFGQRSMSQAPAKSCGNCREFVEDQEGGRGTCMHPGSGILSPWTDTAACDFFAARRR